MLGSAYQNLWTIDPIGLKVTESNHQVDYSYHPDLCVNWLGSQLESRWLSASGWYMYTWEHQHFTPYWQLNYEALAGEGIQTMHNNTFCVPVPTTKSKYGNKIVAWDDGWPSYSWGITNSGGCSSLLFGMRAFGRYY